VVYHDAVRALRILPCQSQTIFTRYVEVENLRAHRSPYTVLYCVGVVCGEPRKVEAVEGKQDARAYRAPRRRTKATLGPGPRGKMTPMSPMMSNVSGVERSKSAWRKISAAMESKLLDHLNELIYQRCEHRPTRSRLRR
jgi:hypothetical protein